MKCTRQGGHKIPVALAVERRVSGAMTGETAEKRAGNTNRKISICESAFEIRVPSGGVRRLSCRDAMDRDQSIKPGARGGVRDAHRRHPLRASARRELPATRGAR